MCWIVSKNKHVFVFYIIPLPYINEQFIWIVKKKWIEKLPKWKQETVHITCKVVRIVYTDGLARQEASTS